MNNGDCIMYFLSILILIISANLDVLAIGFSYGIKRRYISFLNLFIISFITLIGTLISMSLGSLIEIILPKGVANVIGGFTILVIGCYGLFKALLYNIKNKEKNILNLDYRQVIILGITLANNNFTLGIGSSIAGFGVLITSFSSFLMCFTFFYVGNRIGMYLSSKNVGILTEILSNLIMIILGFFELFYI